MASIFSSPGEVAGTIASENPSRYRRVENSHPTEYAAKKRETTSNAFTVNHMARNNPWCRPLGSLAGVGQRCELPAGRGSCPMLMTALDVEPSVTPAPASL